jgi:hypothetical protein
MIHSRALANCDMWEQKPSSVENLFPPIGMRDQTHFLAPANRMDISLWEHQRDSSTDQFAGCEEHC